MNSDYILQILMPTINTLIDFIDLNIDQTVEIQSTLTILNSITWH